MDRFSLLSRAVASVALLALAACGESSPSEATAKKYIKEDLKDCDPIVLADFQKTNGFLQRDGSYLVDVKYTLKFKPTSDLKKHISEYVNKSPGLEKEILSAEEDSRALILGGEQFMAKDHEVREKMQALEAYKNNISKAFYAQCAAIPPNIGGLQIFGLDYLLKLRNGENLSIDISQRIHFMKSDNGWVPAR